MKAAGVGRPGVGWAGAQGWGGVLGWPELRLGSVPGSGSEGKEEKLEPLGLPTVVSGPNTGRGTSSGHHPVFILTHFVQSRC